MLVAGAPENFTSVCAVTDLSGIAIFCVKHIPREKVILMTDVGLLFGGEAFLQTLGIDCPVALRANRVVRPIAIVAMRKLNGCCTHQNAHI
jgi:hypothetical protein